MNNNINKTFFFVLIIILPTYSIGYHIKYTYKDQIIPPTTTKKNTTDLQTHTHIYSFIWSHFIQLLNQTIYNEKKVHTMNQLIFSPFFTHIIIYHT